jgi:site-specific recombinase XerD
MNTILTPDRDTKQLSEALGHLSPANLELVASLVRSMGGGNGATPDQLNRPSDGIPQWLAMMESERFSKCTVKLYSYNAARHLSFDPVPTKLGLQAHFAERLASGISPAAVENERKALRSLFSFLRQESLWLLDPTAGLRRVKVHYGNRPCPTAKDVMKVLKVGFLRARDRDKMGTIVRLLATTGLRITEAVSVRKDTIDFKALELRIVGKGDKFRIVPLLPSTARLLRDYIKRRASKSPYVFPGKGAEGHAEIYNIEKTLRRACQRAEVTPFAPHQLRHFYATEMLRHGAKLECVGKILGHSSIGTTADIYRSIRTSEIHDEHIRFAPMNGS